MSLIGKFYYEQIVDEEASNEAERVVMKDALYCEIRIKGDTKTSIKKPVTEELKAQFPESWRAFELNDPGYCTGTPLSCLPYGPAVVHNLLAINIRTVEDLAELPDGLIQKPVTYAMRTAAKAYLDSVKSYDAAVKAQPKEEKEESLPNPVPNPKGKPSPKPKKAA